MAAPDDVPWLDERERATWMSLIGLVEALPTVLDAQLKADAGLTSYEYMVLAMLSEAPDRTRRMGDLAAVTRGSQSRMSHLAGRLEQRGWLTRSPDPANGRSTLATLTDAGWDTLVGAAPDHVRTVRALVLDPLTEEQVAQLGCITRAIQQRIDQASC